MTPEGNSGSAHEGFDQRVSAFTQENHGVLSLAQARSLGASKSMVEVRIGNGRWEKIFQGVYRIAGTSPTMLQSMMAAMLWSAPDGLVSHGSAAWLWGIDGFVPPKVDVAYPNGRGRKSSKVNTHRLRGLIGSDLRICQGISVTSPERTLVDLAAILPEWRVDRAIESALRRRLTTRFRIRRRFEELAVTGRPGVVQLRAVLAARREKDAPDGSVLETKFRDLLIAHNLPAPIPQHEVRLDRQFAGRIDVVYLTEKIAIELDSWEFHSDRQAFERDRLRQNDIVVGGWMMLRFTDDQIRNHPEKVVATLRRALQQNAA